jgi:uncharacterized phiE125 gp8 family phage protein
MTLFRTAAPQAEPVTVGDVKAHLRLAHDSEDAFIAGLIAAARAEVETQAGLALVLQSWRLVLDDWPASGVVLLRRHPVRLIHAVTVYGVDGEASILDPQDYLLDAASRPARLGLAERPRPGRRLNGVEIDFAAGFGEGPGDVPETLRRAVTMLAAHWFEFRTAFAPDEQPVAFPAGFDRLIAAHRPGRL